MLCSFGSPYLICFSSEFVFGQYPCEIRSPRDSASSQKLTTLLKPPASLSNHRLPPTPPVPACSLGLNLLRFCNQRPCQNVLGCLSTYCHVLPAHCAVPSFRACSLIHNLGFYVNGHADFILLSSYNYKRQINTKPQACNPGACCESF